MYPKEDKTHFIGQRMLGSSSIMATVFAGSDDTDLELPVVIERRALMCATSERHIHAKGFPSGLAVACRSVV